jgi:succinyl-CoA synthetase beta subunit
VNIHENQAKDIFEKYGIPVHPRLVASSGDEVLEKAKDFTSSDLDYFVIKAMVHAGARGKAGGVKISKNLHEIKKFADGMIGKNLVTIQTGSEGKPVDKVLVELTSEIEKEYYTSVVLDRSAGQPCLIVSESGGMNIEEVAEKDPSKILKTHFSIEKGLSDEAANEIADQLVGKPEQAAVFSKIFKALGKIFVDLDCSLIEINPLSTMKNGDVIAIDAKINFDDNALYKHPEVAALHDPRQDDPRELEASKYGLSYVGLEGNIGCVVNGAGLAMATMDIIKFCGGEPANFLDVGGGADEKKVAAAFKIILQDPNVKAILVNIFGGIMRCDVVAEGILKAVKELNPEGASLPRNIALVVRLEGTNVEQGKKLLEESGLKLIAASELEDAARKVVEAAR